MRKREQFKAQGGEVLLGALQLCRAMCKPLGLHSAYLSLLIHLVKKTSLFDRAYYLETNSDVAESEMPPLRHYVTFGDREGRSPMAFFDPTYYRSQTSSRLNRINALLHYAYVGRYRRISPSPWFDVEFYLANNKDVARAGVDPVLHYLKWGGFEGRQPCAQFDGAYYLRAYPEVADARVNPLLHYLLRGRQEGRSTLPGQFGDGNSTTKAGSIARLSQPGAESWSDLEPRANIDHAEVDVVVPVYKGRVETLRCVYSVLAAVCRTSFELVVINDASPEPELVDELNRLADRKLFTLITATGNRGFVKSANQGMQLHGDRDVVLLNSDAEVYDGWLDRLRSAATRNERTGTVTPLSNNATICSYPHFLSDNPFPLELGYAELDALIAEVNSGAEAETPTAVGFCMYIKRACLRSVGLFDEETFGKGYGEENDFCQRAIRKGWRNIIAADVFVRHWGSASFQGEKAKRLHHALQLLDKRYPNYHTDIREFIARDPIRDARRRIDWARLARMRREKNVLLVCHNRGGGTERHVQEDIQRLTAQNYSVYVLRPAPGEPKHGRLSHSSIKWLPNMPPLALTETNVLPDLLQELSIAEVHTHSLVDFAPETPEYLIATVRALGAKWEANIHDYEVICPRINLADENGRYCGEPDDRQCNKCLADRGSDFNVQNIRAWRAMHERMLMAADNVLVPNEDVAKRLSRYSPRVRFEISPHDDIDSRALVIRTPQYQDGDSLRIVVIGAVSKLKGFDVLLACARHAQQANLPLDFVVMGYGLNDRLLRSAGVTITGKYRDQDAADLLCKLQPHAAWLPSLWPETYSYTLSLALEAALPVFAFDIGAIAHRLRIHRMTEGLMPLEWVDMPAQINARFLHQTAGREWTNSHIDARHTEKFNVRPV